MLKRMGLLLIASTFVVACQTAAEAEITPRLNFAVPDAPAFELIQVDQSTILRPTSVREICIGLSEFTGADNALITIPRSFAVELAPGLLLGGRTLTLESYQKYAAWYRLRVSGATRRLEGEDGPSQLALGLRVSIIDDSDLRTNSAYLEEAEKISKQRLAIFSEATGFNGETKYTPEQIQELETLDDSLRQLKEDWQEQTWNARVLDIAFAARAVVSDSICKDLEVDRFSCWATYGNPLGPSGQLLVGANFGSEQEPDSDDFRFLASLAARAYIGTNEFKGFGEAKVSKVEAQDIDIMFNSGVEVNVAKDMWLVFSAGGQFDGETETWDIISRAKFNVGLPGVE